MADSRMIWFKNNEKVVFTIFAGSLLAYAFLALIATGSFSLSQSLAVFLGVLFLALPSIYSTRLKLEAIATHVLVAILAFLFQGNQSLTNGLSTGMSVLMFINILIYFGYIKPK